MPVPKLETSKDGEPLHFSAGALIKQNEKYLLIDRMHPPFGFAGPAGHIDEGESPEVAVRREVLEETGLTIGSCELLFEEEVKKNCCKRGVDTHYWYVFSCTVSGEVKTNEREVKSSGWYTASELKELKLEEVWKYWFKKLKII